MNYTFCKTCENEFDLDEIGEDNKCPHCESEYDWMRCGDDDEEDEPVIGDFLADDGDWE